MITGFSVSAQLKGEPITIGEQIEIESKILGETRPLLIGLPQGYESGTSAYPVLYLLDGWGHFHHTTGTVQFLARNDRIPEMIVVGIPNTSDRTHDLTPPITVADKSNFPTAGGADKMLEFISEELFPFIEENYRTQPFRTLIGHSFGGLFAVHAMVHQPELFDALLAISPSLWWDEQTLVSQAEAWLAENRDYQGRLYMTMGNEGGAMLGGAWKLSAVLEEKAPAGLQWEFRLMDEETHGSIPHRSTYYGLEMLFKDYRGLEDPLLAYNQGGLEAINNHYRSLEEKFGLKDVKPPEDLINQLGYVLLAEKRVKEAIEAFQQNVRDYPGSFNVYDSLGEGYKENGQIKEAIEYYEKSMELNPGNTNGIKMLAELGVEYQPKKVKVSPDILQSYTGKYVVGPGMEVVITLENGRLFGQAAGQPKVELFPISDKRFYLQDENLQVEFNNNDQKEVTSITVYDNGQPVIGVKQE